MQLRNILRTVGRDKSLRLTSKPNSVPTARRSRRCSTKLVLRLGKWTTAATRSSAPTPALRSLLISGRCQNFSEISFSSFRLSGTLCQDPVLASSNNDDLVARSGFEPLISALRGLHPRPLDERAGE